MSFNTFRSISLLIILAGVLIYLTSAKPGEAAQPVQPQTQDEVISSDTLVILWTSADPEVAKNMVFMYAFNAKKYGWWDEIVFITWGPSARLLSENSTLQESIVQMKDAGVILKACKACADNYRVAVKLEELGVEVIYMGKELTDYVKGDLKVMTF